MNFTRLVSQRLLFSNDMSRYVSTLPHRKVLKVSGVDTRKFLQGLCSNDLFSLVDGRQAMATAFLTSKGRIFATSLLYKTTTPATSHHHITTILIETHQSYMESLKRHLTLYKLRSKVKIEDTNYQVAWSEKASDISNAITVSADPRIEGLGYRAIVGPGSYPSLSEEQYRMKNILCGLAEGPEIANRIPLECNLDLLHHIAFDKGCYMGQELTARTKYKGLVRKRLVPFLTSLKVENRRLERFDLLPERIATELLEQASDSIPLIHGLSEGCKVYRLSDVNEQGMIESGSKSVGEVILTSKNAKAGMAILNIEALFSTSPGQFVIAKKADGDRGGEEVQDIVREDKKDSEIVGYISPFRPTWFQGLNEQTNLPV